MDHRTEPRGPEDVSNPEVLHEKRDINARIVIGFGASLAVATILVHVFVWLVFDLYGGLNTSAFPREYPLVQSGQLRLPPSPRLQEKPREDLKALRRHEDELLDGYTWINKTTGAVRIPVAQAMKEVLEQGFPVEEQPEPGALPEKSNSARTMEPSPKR